MKEIYNLSKATLDELQLKALTLKRKKPFSLSKVWNVKKKTKKAIHFN